MGVVPDHATAHYYHSPPHRIGQVLPKNTRLRFSMEPARNPYHKYTELFASHFTLYSVLGRWSCANFLELF